MTGLCYRCEHRALFLETGGKYRPRYECGETGYAKRFCYMYDPVKPVVVAEADKKDPRPLFGPPIVAGHARAVRVADGKYRAKQTKDGNYVIWFWPSK